jgi:hypothetical protein
MVTLDQIAQAALQRERLQLRSLVQDYLRENGELSSVRAPSNDDNAVTVMAAGIVELLADRRQQSPPAWTRLVGPLAEPFYLVAAAQQMTRLRHLCETEAPEPLRRRRLFAPPNFLAFV